MKKVIYSVLALVFLTVVIAFLPCRPCEQPVTVAASIVVDIPQSEAWEILQDFSVPHHYVPDLAATEIVSDLKSGLGAHRRVYNEDGSFIEETIVEWTQGSGFVINLHEGSEVMAPFNFAQFRYLLESDNPDRCRIRVSMSTRMPMGYVGLALQKWVIKGVATESLKGVAAGMKLYYETGKPAVALEREALKSQVLVES